MVAAGGGLCVVDHHAVEAGKAVDQRLDVHRAQACLAVGDDYAGLHDVVHANFAGELNDG